MLIRQNLLRHLQHFAIACLILSGQVAAETDSTSIGLSSNEQAWLREHPVIRLAPDPNFAPIEWFNQQGDYNGITSDYVLLLQELLGVRFEILRGSNWQDILAKAKNGAVDVLSAVDQSLPGSGHGAHSHVPWGHRRDWQCA